MADNDATIRVSVDGAEEVAKAAEKVASAWSQAGSAVGGSWKKAGASILDSVSGVTSDIFRAITVTNALDFKASIEGAKVFRDTIARASAATGQSFDSIKAKNRETANDILVDEQRTLAWSKAVGRLTYDYKGAQESLGAFGKLAAETNQDIEEQAGLAKMFGSDFNIKGEQVIKTLENMKGMAAAVGTTGGLSALKDQMEALGPVASMLSLKTDQQKKEFMALQAALGKNLTPAQAQRVQQGLASFAISHQQGLTRALGHDVLDEQGHLMDLPGLVREMRKDMGKGKNARAIAMQNQNFGPEVGAALFNADFDKNYSAALGANGIPLGAQDAYKRSDAGKRQADELRNSQNRMDLANKATTVTDFAARHPYLAGAGTFLAKEAGKYGVRALKTRLLGTTVAEGAEAAGTGLFGGAMASATGMLASLGALTAATAPLNAASPQIRDETEAQLQGAREGRARAIVHAREQSGGTMQGFHQALGPALEGQIGQDQGLQDLAEQLAANNEVLSGLDASIAKAVADALKGSPLQITIQNDSDAKEIKALQSGQTGN